MVARHGARQTRGDADGQKLGLAREDGKHDGDEDAERAPAGSRGERQPPCHEEDDGGKHAEQARGGPLHAARHELGGAQRAGHALQREREREDEDGRHHGVEARDDAVHGVFELHHAARDQVHEREDERDDGSPRQRRERVGAAEGDDDVQVAFRFGIPEPADVEHSHDAQNDEHEDGDDHVQKVRARVLNRLVAAERPELALAQRCELGFRHGAVVEAHDDDGHDEHEREQRVEVERDGADEQLDAVDVQVGGDAGHRCRPGRHGRDHAHWRRRGIDEVGQLRARHPLRVGDGAHDRSDGQAVEVVVHEDEHAQHERGYFRADAASHVLRSPRAECRRCPRRIDERHQNAQDHEERENARAVGDGGYKPSGQGVFLGAPCGDECAADDGVHGADRVEPGEQERTHHDADEQRAIGFFRDERKNDGDDGRHERPEGVGELHLPFLSLLCCEYGSSSALCRGHGSAGKEIRAKP